MKTYAVTYLSCQSCEAKANCSVCDRRLTEELLGLPGVVRAEVHMLQKQLRIEADTDEDELLDLLEGMGLFV